MLESHCIISGSPQELVFHIRTESGEVINPNECENICWILYECIVGKKNRVVLKKDVLRVDDECVLVELEPSDTRGLDGTYVQEMSFDLDGDFDVSSGAINVLLPLQ